MPSRREQIQMTDEEVRAFLGEQMVMQCATVGPRGLPHMVPLWYVPEGTELVGWTYAKSQKARNLERDPRATIGIEEGVQYHELRGVMFECDVRLERDPAEVEKHGLALFARYYLRGDPSGPTPRSDLVPEIRQMVAGQAPKRVGLRFVPARVVSWDHRKLGGGY
jgi:nitroimidazol reductase NimA-like FMN-containing flavoprotein (pyridoxamine 5'-phosphate oxidase superfamily)